MISRKTCERIKGMSEEEMDDFISKKCNSAYKNGFEDAYKNAIPFCLEEFREKLMRFRGLGANKANGVIKVVQEMIRRKE